MVGVKRKADKVIHKNSKYFFLNEHLHRRLQVNRQRNLILAYDFDDHVKKTYMYNEYMAQRKPAFTVGEAAKLCNRSYWHCYRIFKYELETDWHKAYNPFEDTDWYQFYVSPDQVMMLYDFLASVRQGVKRGSKKWLREANDLPLRQEVLGAMQLYATHYIEDEEGNLIPVYKAN